MTSIEIKRGYEVLPDNNVRFGIRIANTSDVVISEVEVILDYSELLFKLEGERVQKIGNIPPNGTRTAEFILKPLGCVHQVNIEALISYRDTKYARQRVDMQPKEVHCVCPFLKGKAMPRAEFLELSNSGNSAEIGLNFNGISVERLASYLVQTCKSRHHTVDDYSVDGGKMLYLASESIGEKAYYLLTALIKEEDGLTQVMLRAVSDKPYGLNGFLNETVAELRIVVSTVQSAQEIGIIRNEQVINIIDSIVQRSSFGGVGGSGSVNIQDSVVQRTEFNAGEDDTPIIEQSIIENGVKIGDVTFDIKYLKPRLDQNSVYENVSGNTAAFSGKKWTPGAPSTFVETPYGFIGISKTGVERGVVKELENAVQRNEITVFGNVKPLLLEKESEKRENIENLYEEESQKYGVNKDSKKQERPINQKRKTGTSNFALSVIFVILVFGLWSLGTGSNDVQDVPALSSQSEVVPESTDPMPSVQSDVASEVSQTPAPSYNQKNYTNSIGMEFVLILAGEFDMGSPSIERDRRGNEGPVHHVTISNDFYMGKYEVTQKQWHEVMGTNPSHFKGDDLPVESVSWNDINEFITKLNGNEDTDKYRLPSEAEWEYACRAGTTTRYHFGDDESKLVEYAWYAENSGSRPPEKGDYFGYDKDDLIHNMWNGTTHSVGQKMPNPWGLYDMHGNVWEWVQDVEHANYIGAPFDGSAWEGEGNGRVNRGSSWNYYAYLSRSACRIGTGPDGGGYNLGFRLILEP